MIDTYIYSGQLRQYIRQFCLVFSGLHVSAGLSDCGEQEFVTVPVVVGNKDRVVAALMAGNTKNKTFSLPIMAAHLSGLSMADERRKAPNHIHQRTTMPVGGVFPDDLVTLKRAVPVPYNASFELSLYASNTMQLHEILEQLLVLFNPDMTIQKSDGPYDWTKLTTIKLADISNEENYPAGTDKRILVWTLQFEVPIWLSLPMGTKDDVVRRIFIRLSVNGTDVINEVDADGHIMPFGEPIATIVVDSREQSGPTPVGPKQI